MEDIGIPLEICECFVDDQNLALWSIGRDVMFCPLDGNLKSKSQEQIEDEIDIREDILVMQEVRKVADTIIPMLKTEEDSPGHHPELDFKVPILDEAVWVETVTLHSQGMDLHINCDTDVPCLPLGKVEFGRGLEEEDESAPKMV